MLHLRRRHLSIVERSAVLRRLSSRHLLPRRRELAHQLCCWLLSKPARRYFARRRHCCEWLLGMYCRFRMSCWIRQCRAMFIRYLCSEQRPERVHIVCRRFVSVAPRGNGLRDLSCGSLLRARREYRDAMRGGELPFDAWCHRAVGLHTVSCRLGLRGWLRVASDVRGGQRFNCRSWGLLWLQRGHVPELGERFRVRRMSKRSLLPRTLGIGARMQSWHVSADQRSEQLLRLRCGYIPIVERRDGVRHMPSWIVLCCWCEHIGNVRCW